MKKLVTAALVAMLVSSAARADWVGDFAPGTTAICGQYTTYNPSTGAPATLAGTPVLAVYKIGDGTNSTTESTTGLTHAEDVDSRTGLNRVCIDTSADGTFYSAGGQFSIVITTGTVNSVSVVGSEVKSFSLNKVSALRPATAGRTLVVDSAGLADANTVKVGPTGSGTAQTARDLGAGVLVASGGIVEASFASDTSPRFGILTSGTAQSGSTSTTLVLASATNFTADNRIQGATCAITGGTGSGASLTVASYVNSTDTATMGGTWPTTPDNTSTYTCYRTAPSSGGSGLDAAGVRAAVGLASANLDTQLGAIDDYIDTEVAAIKTKTDFLPSATAGASGGLLIAGTNADFDVTANVSLAGGLSITQSSSNTAALVVTGNGTGNGATVTSGSGATGNALALVAASTNGTGLTSTGSGTGNGATFTSGSGATGNGISVTAASTNGNGLAVSGTGTGSGLIGTGGATGHGINGVGGSTSGNGLRASGTAGNSAAASLVGQGSAAGLLSTGGATGAGISAVGGSSSGAGLSASSTSGNGFTAAGGGTGHGIAATSGSGATGNGISATASSTNGNGIASTGAGTGSGEFNTGGATGHGMLLAGGSTSGMGLSTSITNPLGAVPGFGIQESGTLQSATSTTAVLRAATSFTTDNPVGMTLEIIGGTGVGQSRPLTAWNNTSKTATVATWTTTPDNTSDYLLWGTSAASGGGGSGPDAATIADAVLDEVLSGHTTSGTVGERLGRIPNAAAGGNGGLPTVDANNRIAGIQGTLTTLDALDTAQDSQHATTQGRLPSALVSGRMDVSVGAYQSGQAPLQPTVAGRTLDVSAGGEAGIDLANVGSPTTTLNLSGTTISTTQAVASVSGAVGSVTGNVGGNVTGSVGSVTGAVGSVTGNVGGTVNGLTSTAQGNVRSAVGLASANLDTQLTAIDDYVDTEVAAVKATTDKLDTALELDGSVYRYTVNALEQAPVGGGGGSTDWTSDERAAIRAILGVPGSGPTPTDPSVGILDTIRDGQANLATASALTSLSNTVGVAGAGLTAADDAVMARLGAPSGASMSADIAAVKSDSAAILVDTAEIGAAGAGLTAVPWNSAWAVQVRGSLGMSSANMDAQLGAIVSALTTIDDFVDTEIAAIKAKTDQLTFGVSNELNVNVESMNAQPVCGTGDDGTPWTGCP